MAVPVREVFFPSNFPDLFQAWSRFPDAVLYAGGSEFFKRQGNRVPELPQHIISLDKMGELKRISRTERYLEIGAMVRLSQIINLGKIVPEALSLCVEGISGIEVRNFATIGGNICNKIRRLDTTAPMTALDAQFELRMAQSSRWISASRFLSLPGPPAIEAQEILTRIRIPLEPWTYTWYHKFRSMISDEPGGCMLIMIRNQKDILTNIRVIYSGKTILREKNCETLFEGKHLPLERNAVDTFVDKWNNYLSMFEGNEDSIYPGKGEKVNPELKKTQILNFLETTLLHFSD